MQFTWPASSPFGSHPLPSLLEPYSRFHFEFEAQRDGDIETMAVRALHKAKFQQLGISDFYAVQRTTGEDRNQCLRFEAWELLSHRFTHIRRRAGPPR